MTGITLGAKRKNLKGKLEKPEAISQKKRLFILYPSGISNLSSKVIKFPPDAVLSTSGGSSIFITRKFQRHRGQKKTPDNVSVFSHPSFRFVTVYRRRVNTQLWRSWRYTMNFAMNIWANVLCRANAIRPYIYLPIYPYRRIAYAQYIIYTLNKTNNYQLFSPLIISLLAVGREGKRLPIGGIFKSIIHCYRT